MVNPVYDLTASRGLVLLPLAGAQLRCAEWVCTSSSA